MKSLIFLLFLTVFNQIETKTAAEANILGQFVINLQKPLTLHILALCWPQREVIKWTKTLHTQNIRTRFFTDHQLHAWRKTLNKTEDVAFVVDLNCALEADNSLKIANKTGAYLAPLTWILLKTAPKNPNKLTVALESLNLFLPVSSRVYLIENVPERNPQEFNITSLYRLPHTAYIVNLVAYVAADARFLYFTRLADARHRRDLRSMSMNCTSVMLDPRTIHHQLDGRERHIDPVLKVMYPQTLHMFDYVNATPVIQYRPIWGFVKPDGTYGDNSMMKDYQDATIEIAATVAFVLKDRMRFVACYQAYHTVGAFTFRPPPLSSVHNVYLLTYSRAVWVAFFALMAVFVAVFYTITYFETRLPAMRTTGSASLMEHKMADLVLLDVSLVCQQGMEAEPGSLAGHVATFIALLSTLFLFIAYSAKILTLIQSTSDEINSVQALYDARMKIGFEDVPYSRFLLRSAEEPIMQRIFRERVAPPGKQASYVEAREGVRRMRDEFFAFHAESWVIYNLIEQEYHESQKCGIREIRYFKPQAYAGCRRTSPYKEIFASGYRKFDEYGIGTRAFRRINVQKPKCSGSAAIFASISMTDIYAAYLIFSVGLLVCCMIFACEQIHWRRIHGSWFLKLRNTTFFQRIKSVISKINNYRK